ncbi:histidine phosphatase family protein, partial [Herbaspirillum sp. B65]
MTDILLIRHGETDWNVDKRLQGHIDIGLNQAGQRQVLALGEALAGEGIDAIFASDLQRARDTAQAVADAAGLEVLIDAGLRERCYGAFEGLRHIEIEARYPDAYRQWKARDPDYRYPAGERMAETMREFYERSVQAVQRVLGSGRYRKVAIVTHGGVLECVHHWASQTSFAQPR